VFCAALNDDSNDNIAAHQLWLQTVSIVHTLKHSCRSADNKRRTQQSIQSVKET